MATDYDLARHRFVNSSASIYAKYRQLTVIASQYLLKTDTVLAPAANQTWFRAAYGSSSRRGFSYGLDTRYDFIAAKLLSVETQVTYNTDCCGFSVQYISFPRPLGGTDSTFRFAFAVSNIGTVGNITPQARLN